MPKRLLLITLVLFGLTACVGRGPVSPKQVDIDAELQSTQASPESALKRYQNELNQTEDEAQRARFKVLIAEAHLELEEYKQLGALLPQIDKKLLMREDMIRLMCIRAAYLNEIGQAHEGVKTLPKNQADLPRALQLKILTTQAKVLEAAGYRIESVRSRIELQRLLMKPESLDTNGRRILSSLSSLPEPTLKQVHAKNLSTDMNGWIDFVLTTKSKLFSLPGFDTAVLEWQSKNPENSVPQSLIDTLRSAIEQKMNYPDKVAVMLPLTGRYAKPAQSIRDGILGAYYSSDREDKPELVFIDTEDKPETIPDKLKLAYADGANLVLGPLTKDEIASLDQFKRLPVPVLALNYIDRLPDNKGNPRPATFFQFGLLPEDEATQAARMALLRNQMRALVLVPKNTFGKRMAEAFRLEYERFGGNLLRVQEYDLAAKDFGRPIKSMLNIQQSQSRNSILQTVLRQNLKFEPRIRQDIDVIYMVATAAQARGIKPQLKFHEAGDIPVLANSQVFNGRSNPSIDKDINGVVFTQTPWTLKAEETPLHQQLMEVWQADVLRHRDLYALGADAFNLIPYLGRITNDEFFHVDAYSGTLSADAEWRIHRELLWAKFEEGMVKLDDNPLLEFKDTSEQDIDNETEGNNSKQ